MSSPSSQGGVSLSDRLERIDRRFVYLLIALALALPIIFGWKLPPAEMETADAFFAVVDELKPEHGKLVLIASDWGPGTQAENKPQTMIAMEHLMRKRVPFGLISITPYAAPFLESMPRDLKAKLEAEAPGETWTYGTDWINFGYRPGFVIMIQGLAKATDLHDVLKTDVSGTPLADLPIMKGVHTIRNIAMLMEFTGLVSAFNFWVQFFQADGYKPPFVHGCTSITIPEAYIYYVSKQIVGLYEGVAGAAWYENLLSKKYPERESGTALKINTSLAVAHVVIIALMILGNVGYLISRRSR
ncbi:MAG: hypothetical protein KDD66_09035 [Bdellovibrionales bacterium]|nr:hypothetical protein [Bdellovibrionales bacterium]